MNSDVETLSRRVRGLFIILFGIMLGGLFPHPD